MDSKSVLPDDDGPGTRRSDISGCFDADVDDDIVCVCVVMRDSTTLLFRVARPPPGGADDASPRASRDYYIHTWGGIAIRGHSLVIRNLYLPRCKP